MLEQASYRISSERNKRGYYKNPWIKRISGRVKGGDYPLINLYPRCRRQTKESVQLTEKQNEQKNEAVEEILTGKNILILGGYRSKGHIEANGYPCLYT